MFSLKFVWFRVKNVTSLYSDNGNPQPKIYYLSEGHV